MLLKRLQDACKLRLTTSYSLFLAVGGRLRPGLGLGLGLGLGKAGEGLVFRVQHLVEGYQQQSPLVCSDSAPSPPAPCCWLYLGGQSGGDGTKQLDEPARAIPSSVRFHVL